MVVEAGVGAHHAAGDHEGEHELVVGEQADARHAVDAVRQAVDHPPQVPLEALQLRWRHHLLRLLVENRRRRRVAGVRVRVEAGGAGGAQHAAEVLGSRLRSGGVGGPARYAHGEHVLEPGQRELVHDVDRGQVSQNEVQYCSTSGNLKQIVFI